MDSQGVFVVMSALTLVVCSANLLFRHFADTAYAVDRFIFYASAVAFALALANL